MALPLAKLRIYLSLIPLLRSRPGITFKEIGDHLGMSAQAVAREIPEALMLCGVPPYMPHDYIACFTEGDRVTLRFADHFKRPARLTLGEAAAMLIALRSMPPARGAPQAPAVAGLMLKLERALGTGAVKKLVRRIGARRGSGALGQRLATLQTALEQGQEVEIEYYTARRRVLSKRRLRPYALLDRLGRYYVIGRDSQRGKELSFRVDRMRSVTPTGKTFEKPKSFNPQRYRKPDLYRPSSSDIAVKAKLSPDAARFAQEGGFASDIKQKASGAAEVTVRTDVARWIVDWALQFGMQAEVTGPKSAREEMKGVLDDWQAFYDAHKR